MQRTHTDVKRSRLWAGLACAGALAGTFLQPLAVQAQGGINVLLNGSVVNFGGVQPEQVGGRVMVPLRAVFEALGAKVDFNAQTNTVFAVRGNSQVQLSIGSTQAFVNNQSRTLDVPAQTRFGRVMVPLRFVSEAMGAQVLWNEAQRTVIITDNSATATPTPLPTTPPVPTPTPLPVPTATPTPVPTPTPVTTPAEAAVNGSFVRADAANDTIFVNVGDQLHSYSLAPGAVVTRRLTAGTVALPAMPITLSNLLPGEDVRLRLNAANQATHVTAMANIILRAVRQVQGKQAVLDDPRGTTLIISPNLRFIDNLGRTLPAFNNITPGSQLALFVAPSTNTIYMVSGRAVDIGAAQGVPMPPGTLPPGTPPSGTPLPGATPTPVPQGRATRIDLVQHTAARPLRSGDTLTVTVRGTPGARGSFDISPRLTDLPLDEAPGQRGVYTGVYTVREGDDVLNRRITAHLTAPGLQEAIAQSQQPVTIDTVAPRITGTFPADRAVITVAQPNITIFADDIGGSGIDRATLRLTTAAGQNVNVPLTVTPPSTITGVPAQALSGQVTAQGAVFDVAGNRAVVNFSFRVNATAGGITALTHSATRALQTGDNFTVDMTAPPGGRAYFDLIGDDNRFVTQNVPMVPTQPGRYRGTYSIQGTEGTPRLRVVGRFVDAAGQASTAETTTMVNIAGQAAAALAIAQPIDGAQVDSPLVVRGQAAPNALVDVAIHVHGTRLLVFAYDDDLGAVQVRANARGNWVTQAIELPRPRNVTDLQFTISATQTDAFNRRSDPVTATVTLR